MLGTDHYLEMVPTLLNIKRVIMKLSIRKIGNSAGIIIPTTLLQSLNISVGSSVNAEQVDGALVLTPVTNPGTPSMN